jgi:LPXTG-motif cell wall-anchored protein
MGKTAGSENAAEPAKSGSLPATASNAPLMTLIGAIALGVASVVWVLRRRRTAQS